jgi:sugar lactone lactonase YvrE
MRGKLALLTWLVIAASATAQDMPLSEILAPNEGWQRVQGLAGVDSLAADGKGTVYAGESATGRITAIDPAGKLKPFATVVGLRGMAVGPDGLLYVCQPKQRRLVTVDGAGKEKVVADEVSLETVVVSRSGRCYGTASEEHAVYAIEPDGKKRRAAEGLTQPSGLALWADQGTLVVGNAAGKHLWAYRISSDGSLTAGDAYYALRTRPKEASDVVGLTTDSKARLYAATREGVQVFDPTGRMCGVLSRPERAAVTGAVFGGEALDRLFSACGGNLYVRKTLARGLPAAISRP